MEASIQKRDQELREAAGLLEQRVHDRTQELVATQAALVEAERFAAMGKTSAAIAHELKNALNGLGMAVELIAQDPANSARVARLRPQVVGEIARLRDVVDSLLSFSRSPRIERAPADLAAVVARAAEAVSDLVADRGVKLTVNAPPTLPVRCDAHKIQGVMVNLIKNAVEAGRAVTVAVGARDGEATIEVGDDGPGCRPRRARTCSSRSSPPSRTAPGWGCRPRAGSSRRTAAPSRSASRRPAARCSACGFRSTARPA